MSPIKSDKNLHKELEKSLKELEDIKFALDEHAVVSITDKDGKITYANDKFCEVSKYSKKELLGKDHRIINSGYHPKEFMRDLWKTITSGKVWKGQVCNKAKDGTFYWVDTTIVPFLNEKGNPYQYVSIRTNISQRKKREKELENLNEDFAINEKAMRLLYREKERKNQKLIDTEKQLIQSEKMATMGTLAAGFAHAIKNPLGVIMQSIEKIEKNLTKSKDTQSMPFINIIKKATIRADTVVTSILRYSRSSSPEKSPINIYEMMDGAIELIESSGELEGIKLTKSYERADFPVYGDTIMLQQVFFDLITNAVHAMPDGGEINVNIRFNPMRLKINETGQYIIEIIDTGDGINAKDVPRIFDPFFTTKEEGKGTGLGLNTVYLIIQKYGGNIKVDSKIGEGTKFTIMIPAGKVVSETKTHPKTNAGGKNNGK